MPVCPWKSEESFVGTVLSFFHMSVAPGVTLGVPGLCPYPLSHLAGSLSFCTGSLVTQATLKPVDDLELLIFLPTQVGLQACTHVPGSMGYIRRWQFWCATASNWNICSYTCSIMATLDSLFTYVVVAIDKCSLQKKKMEKETGYTLGKNT